MPGKEVNTLGQDSTEDQYPGGVLVCRIYRFALEGDKNEMTDVSSSNEK